jgi:hypothetical protein
VLRLAGRDDLVLDLERDVDRIANETPWKPPVRE